MPAPPRGPRAALILLSAASLVPVFGRAAEAPPAPKPYTLFVGVDLDVQQKRQFLRVRGVVGSSVVVFTDGVELRIPMRDQSLKLRIQESVKLTDVAVQVADLKGDRAYTPAADPARKWTNMNSGVDTSAAVSNYVGTQDAYFQNLGQVNNPSLPSEMRAAIGQMTPTLLAASNSAASSLDRANQEAGSDLYSAGDNSRQLQQELDKKLFDAMDVSFAVASPRPLTDPYVVVLAQYHDPKEPKGTAHNWIYAEALGAVTERPRKVHIMQGGFPPGFELERFTVHLYDHGREVASNVAPKRLELTRDEAFQYLEIEYLSSHKDATLPPALALGRLPAEVRAGLTAAQLAQVWFVKITKDGLPQGVFLDEACTRAAADASLNAVIGDCRFQPALVHGQPVDGVARLALGDLTL